MTEAPRRLKRYYRTKLPRSRIESMLSNNGDMSIHEILDEYNDNWKHGLTMPQLSNILSGDPRFEKSSEKQIVCSMLGNKYKTTIWRVSKCRN